MAPGVPGGLIDPSTLGTIAGAGIPLSGGVVSGDAVVGRLVVHASEAGRIPPFCRACRIIRAVGFESREHAGWR